MTRIPIDPRLPRQALRTRLGETSYVLRFSWRERTQAWALDLYTANDEPIVLGRIIEIGGFPLAGLVDSRAPRGILSVVAQSDPTTPPGPSDLGDRVQLVFVSETESRALLGVS